MQASFWTILEPYSNPTENNNEAGSKFQTNRQSHKILLQPAADLDLGEKPGALAKANSVAAGSSAFVVLDVQKVSHS